MPGLICCFHTSQKINIPFVCSNQKDAVRKIVEVCYNILLFINHFNFLLTADPSCIDEQDGIGRTALSYAVHFHQMEMLHYLLENQADVNIASHGNHVVYAKFFQSSWITSGLNQADVNIASHSNHVVYAKFFQSSWITSGLNQADVNIASHSNHVVYAKFFQSSWITSGLNQADVNIASHSNHVVYAKFFQSSWIRLRKKICVFTVRRLTLIFSSDPKLFYGTSSRK